MAIYHKLTCNHKLTCCYLFETCKNSVLVLCMFMLLCPVLSFNYVFVPCCAWNFDQSALFGLSTSVQPEVVGMLLFNHVFVPCFGMDLSPTYGFGFSVFVQPEVVGRFLWHL